MKNTKKKAKQKQKDLFAMLSELSDCRRAQGRMHELRFVLIIVIMSIMSGFYGIRATGDFVEKNRNREEERAVEVYNNITGIDQAWIGLKNIIQVKRTIKYTGGKYSGRIYKETAYFISSLPATTKAKIFNQGIRSHWSIENSLHYVKDKTFVEDSSRVRTGNAPENLSVIRNIILNIFRKNNYQNMAQSIRLISNEIQKMYELIIA